MGLYDQPRHTWRTGRLLPRPSRHLHQGNKGGPRTLGTGRRDERAPPHHPLLLAQSDRLRLHRYVSRLSPSNLAFNPMTTFLEDLADFQERTRQLKFVREHIEKHGRITLHECRYVGIPGYGIVPHPGARIFDLRQGYVIKTLRNPTEWKLISKPEEA